MTASQPDPTTQALHEALFETQISLQTRLLDYIEEADEFHVLDEAWEEFTNFDNREMDPEDPEPVLHFFPWALFYWRRDVLEDALEQAREELLAGALATPESELEDDDDNWLEEIEALDDEAIDEILSDELDDDGELGDEDSYVSMPPIATMFMNSVDGADGAGSKAVGQTLTVRDREFIEAAGKAPYSFFKVSAVGPGAFVTLEDVIVPAQMSVYAPALVDMAEEGDVVYAQVVSLDGAHVLCGVAPAVLPSVVEDALNEARDRLQELVDEIGEDWRYEVEFEMRALYHQMVASLQGHLDGDEYDEGDDNEDDNEDDNPKPIITH